MARHLPSKIIAFALVSIISLVRDDVEAYEKSKSDPGLYMKPNPKSKTLYLIGGWSPGDTVSNFMRRYRPIFEDYLSQNVGYLYDPPIFFKLIPTDWAELGNETTTSHVMIEQGLLDFTCKYFKKDQNSIMIEIM